MHQPNEILDGIFVNVGDDAQNVVDDQPGHLQEQPQSQVVDSKREVMNSFVHAVIMATLIFLTMVPLKFFISS